MFFITNRSFAEGNRSAEMRKVNFDLDNNEASQSVYFCWRDDAKRAYVELGNENFMKAMRKSLTCPPKPGPGIMLEFLTKEDGIWPGKDEHLNR